jgi:uncharacterized membrane protein YhfC
MISQSAIMALLVQVILGVVITLSLLIYYRIKHSISYRAVGVGILVYIVFAQILEQVLHVYLFSANGLTSEWLKNPWLMAGYGALAAGIFENIGRWLGFSFLLKHRQERKDGIAYGIGHGGIEVFIVGVVMGIAGIVFALMLNSGTALQVLGSQATPEQTAWIQDLQERFTQTPQSEYWLGAFERIPTMFLQMALSIIVLYGVRTHKVVHLVYAILLHALIDFFAGLYQAKLLQFWVVEGIVWLGGIFAIMVIVRSKEWFGRLPRSSEV